MVALPIQVLFVTYVENENYPNDSAIDIKFVVKNCVSEKDSCSKLSRNSLFLG